MPSNDKERAPAGLVFGSELRRLRADRSLSQRELADALGYTPSYISKIETGDQPPTRPFAERADEILQSGGHLVALWRSHELTRPSDRVLPSSLRGSGPCLVVEHEVARLELVDGHYRTTIRRHLRNDSPDPVTRYLIRVAVDRHPDASQRSNEFYRQRPLTVEEINLRAWCGDEPMSWQIDHDRDAFKEIWLLFENESGRFPLYHAGTAILEYQYSVSADKWGKWWQRAIRVPTERLSIELLLPKSHHPMVWGIETSLAAERIPVRPAIQRTDEQDVQTYTWSTHRPALHSRYRFEWRFDSENDVADPHLAPSERMRRLGIVQRGDPGLQEPSVPFDLPGEAETAQAVGDRLEALLEPLSHVHRFGKGIGLAAPQIGINRAAAVVALPGRKPLVLFNPEIVATSEEHDVQFEGCLSFFDVRGLVERPLRIDVKYINLNGEARLVEFELAAARHWCHEIDHLSGILYSDRVAPGTELIPIEKYEDIGENWAYGDKR